jgi:predicted  nucleic acid-binding Zn-ribbon protein
MNPDLSRIVRLQQLETAAEDARRGIADYPAKAQALEARLEQARGAVADARARLAAAADRRRAEEKEVATVQARLAKYKDQLLDVKTNREYTAMLHEIETAQNDVRAREDRILEVMLESDELSAAVKRAEADLKQTEAQVAGERAGLDAEHSRLDADLERIVVERRALAAEIDRGVLSTFEQVARSRRGIAVAEARLRPQVFNEIRLNSSIIQCDSCQRILFFTDQNEATAASPPQP